jgi:phosphinothricin acetyltransferase
MQARLAHNDDADAIARIHNQGIEDRTATFETELRTPRDIRHLLAQKGDRLPTVVVVQGADVIAWAAVGAYRDRPCYEGVAEHSVYVDRRARGRGAGRVALEALIAACKERGFWKLVSRIFPENIPSLRLHERVGFRIVGIYHRHGKLDREWRDCVIVEKLIDGAEMP